MKSLNKISIDKPIAFVWHILADEFAEADKWMAVVPRSYVIEEGIKSDGSPVVGRVCELNVGNNPPRANERIVYYNSDEYTMKVEVIPQNAKLPIEKNLVTMSLNKLGENKTEVIWDSDITLKPVGKLMRPVLKLGISKSFRELLEELKYFAETGEPHPRKQKALTKLAS